MMQSSLVDIVQITTNSNPRGNNRIERITPHCIVGQMSAVTCANLKNFKPGGGASANYIIGKDAEVLLNVPEERRAWTSGGEKRINGRTGAMNDYKAITFECASDATSPYAFRPAVYEKLILMCVDICQRHGRKKLIWFNTPQEAEAYQVKADEMILTWHRWYAYKSCIPTDSELLTRNGWVKLSDIKIGDEVASADLDNLKITFEEVYDKVEPKLQDTYTTNGLTATKDHRMVFCTQSNKTMRIETYNRLLAQSKGAYIPNAGYYDGEGFNISDDLLKFLIAVQADGHYMYENTRNGKSYYGIEFHLKKERKIERIKEIIENLDFEFKEIKQSNGTVKIRVYNQNDVNIVDEICEKYLNEKKFTWEWLELSKEQANLFLCEILNWDGCVSGNMYSSSERENIDIISAIASLNGKASNTRADGIGFSELPFNTLGDAKRNQKTEVSCVSVKTGIILIRQKGKTFIVGNCPGDWLYSRGREIAQRVTAELGGVTPTPAPTPQPQGRVKVTANLPMIKKGSKGSAVKTWQTIIGVTSDGDFGSITEANTRKFQSTHLDSNGKKLDVDGIVGSLTWSAGLNSLS